MEGDPTYNLGAGTDDVPKPKKIKIKSKALKQAETMVASGKGSIVSSTHGRRAESVYIGNDDNHVFRGGKNHYSDPKTGEKRKAIIKIKY